MALYKLDTHVHTSNVSGCGKVDAQTVVRLYKEMGYHGIVITDHLFDGYFKKLKDLDWTEQINHYLSGYRLACDTGRELGLNVILGLELRFVGDPNDYLVYGIDEAFLKQHEDIYEMGLANFRQLTRNKNILIYQAHPFRQGMIPADPSLIDGIEVFNGNLRHNSRNDLAFEYAKKHGLKMLSGSDFHLPEDLGTGGIVISQNVANLTELIDVLNKDLVTQLIGLALG